MPTVITSRPISTGDPDAGVVTSTDVYATTMLVWAMDRIGPEVVTGDWHPSTVREECNDALGRPVPQHSFDRLMAAITILTTDSFGTSVPDFINLCNVLSGSPFDPGVFDPADPDECAWGVTEAIMLSPPEPGESLLSPEVEAYVVETLKAYGYLTAPAALSDVDGQLEESRGTTASAAADDPATFEAVWSRRGDKAAATDRAVSEATISLFRQLESLHLKNGDTKNLINRLAAEFGRSNKKDRS